MLYTGLFGALYAFITLVVSGGKTTVFFSRRFIALSCAELFPALEHASMHHDVVYLTAIFSGTSPTVLASGLTNANRLRVFLAVNYFSVR